MSFILDSQGMRVTNATGKTVFDSSRSNPHIVTAATGTLSSGNITGLVGGVSAELNVGTGNIVLLQKWVRCTYIHTATYTSSLYSKNKTFLIPYYKPTLPVTNNRVGAYRVADTSGKWVAANGGLMLRVYSSQKSFTYAAPLQGTQYVHAYVPFDGTMRVEVVTNIFGHMVGDYYSSGQDAVDPDNYTANDVLRGGISRAIPHTEFSIDYKVYIGLI